MTVTVKGGESPGKEFLRVKIIFLLLSSRIFSKIKTIFYISVNN